MNSWKCTRRFFSIGALAKNMSIQHGFAAPDAAEDIESLRRLIAAAAPTPAARASRRGPTPVGSSQAHDGGSAVFLPPALAPDRLRLAGAAARP